jgi:hypothetical protein
MNYFPLENSSESNNLNEEKESNSRASLVIASVGEVKHCCNRGGDCRLPFCVDVKVYHKHKRNLGFPPQFFTMIHPQNINGFNPKLMGLLFLHNPITFLLPRSVPHTKKVWQKRRQRKEIA